MLIRPFLLFPGPAAESADINSTVSDSWKWIGGNEWRWLSYRCIGPSLGTRAWEASDVALWSFLFSLQFNNDIANVRISNHPSCFAQGGVGLVLPFPQDYPAPDPQNQKSTSETNYAQHCPIANTKKLDQQGFDPSRRIGSKFCRN